MSNTTTNFELIAKHISWKNRNYWGYNALDFQIYFGANEMVSSLLNNLTDDEFIEYCTPVTFGALESNDQIDRMVRIVPQSQWKECLRASIQITLRASLAITPLYTENLDVLKYQLQSWVEPFDMSFTKNYHLDLKISADPTIHLLYEADPESAQELLNHIIEHLGIAVAKSFISPVNSRGEDYLTYGRRKQAVREPDAPSPPPLALESRG